MEAHPCHALREVLLTAHVALEFFHGPHEQVVAKRRSRRQEVALWHHHHRVTFHLHQSDLLEGDRQDLWVCGLILSFKFSLEFINLFILTRHGTEWYFGP